MMPPASMLDILIPRKYQTKAREAGKTAKENLEHELKETRKRRRKARGQARKSYARATRESFRNSRDSDDYGRKIVSGGASGSGWDVLFGPPGSRF